MSDSIDRQAAVDIVRKCNVKEVTPAYMLIDKAEIMMELMTLPPAKSEIIRCKDCKHYKAKQGNLPWKNSRKYCNRSVTLAMNPYDFCSYAERRF